MVAQSGIFIDTHLRCGVDQESCDRLRAQFAELDRQIRRTLERR